METHRKINPLLEVVVLLLGVLAITSLPVALIAQQWEYFLYGYPLAFPMLLLRMMGRL